MRACIILVLFSASLCCRPSQENHILGDISTARRGDDLNILGQDCHGSQASCVIDDEGHDVLAVEDETLLLQLSTVVKKSEQSWSGEPASVVRRHIIQDRDIMTSLWSGQDLKQSELLAIRGGEQENTRSDSASRTDKQATAPMKKLRLLGAPDSGTNLLVETLLLNWPDQSRYACESSDSCDPVVWKHSISNASDLNRRFASASNRPFDANNAVYDVTYDTVIVIMTRSPISQMVSWHHAPYSLAPCFERSWAEANSPCFANTSPDWHDTSPGCIVNERYKDSIDFSSSSDVWNTYINQYLAMKGNQAVGPVIMVSFEELVLNPSIVLKQIADVMEWPIPDNFSILDDSAKESQSSRDEVVEKISSRSHLQGLTSRDVEVLCSGLDNSLMTQLYESPHTTADVTYEFDCLHV